MLPGTLSSCVASMFGAISCRRCKQLWAQIIIKQRKHTVWEKACPWTEPFGLHILCTLGWPALAQLHSSNASISCRRIARIQHAAVMTLASEVEQLKLIFPGHHVVIQNCEKSSRTSDVQHFDQVVEGVKAKMRPHLAHERFSVTGRPDLQGENVPYILEKLYGIPMEKDKHFPFPLLDGAGVIALQGAAPAAGAPGNNGAADGVKAKRRSLCKVRPSM